MPRSVWFALALSALSAEPLLAQSPPALDEQQLTGMRLFNQSCRVCHTKPQLSSPQYGPVLSTESLSGKADVMREVISMGTPRMPGFRYHFEPAQIEAIVAYIKTIPAPPTPQAQSAGGRNNSRDAD
jgi:mono/diheme cytochrome c family protein